MTITPPWESCTAYARSKCQLLRPYLASERKVNTEVETATDSGMTVTDSGMTVTDSGMTVTDSGMTVTDSGMTVTDSGMTDRGMTVAWPWLTVAWKWLTVTWSGLYRGISLIQITTRPLTPILRFIDHRFNRNWSPSSQKLKNSDITHLGEISRRDVRGLPQEVYSAFWSEFLLTSSCGEGERVPLIFPDYGQEEWKAIGKNAAEGLHRHGDISRATIICVCCCHNTWRGRSDLPPTILHKSFRAYRCEADRHVIDKACSGSKLNEDDNDDLIDLLSRVNHHQIQKEDVFVFSDSRCKNTCNRLQICAHVFINRPQNCAQTLFHSRAGLWPNFGRSRVKVCLTWPFGALNCARFWAVRALDCAQFLLHPALFPT